MGIDVHGLQFLRYVAARGRLGATATLGRQNLHVSNEILREMMSIAKDERYGPYCEQLLIDKLGASDVTSFDASDYEGATVVHDFNKPVRHEEQYDTVLDFGTTEHIFALPTALSNIAALCKTGGRIVHALPANNYNGHGFWQFSPEMFFSLYSEKNGFSGTEVFIAELDDERHWWAANVPANGIRVEYTSCGRSYVLAATRKQVDNPEQNVQQSDYVMNWQQIQAPNVALPQSMRSRLHHGLKHLPLAWRLADLVVPLQNAHSDARLHRLSASNRHFRKLAIDTLI